MYTVNANIKMLRALNGKTINSDDLEGLYYNPLVSYIQQGDEWEYNDCLYFIYIEDYNGTEEIIRVYSRL